MLFMRLPSLARTFPVLALVSCAAPKADVVEQPAEPKKEVVAEKPKEPEPPAAPGAPAEPNDGIRLPDMMTMPDDSEFRATSPAASVSKPNAGGVIAKPPSEPPPRPKAGE